MHSGRISHPLNMPEEKWIAPSAVKADGQMWTDLKELQDFVVPKEMSLQDYARKDWICALRKCLICSDSMELNYIANGYLLEEFYHQ
jgi:N-ethylmaleimide reductase